jgi:hypothetical protein
MLVRFAPTSSCRRRAFRSFTVPHARRSDISLSRKSQTTILLRDLGDARRVTIKDVFDTKKPNEDIYVVLCETGAHYRIQRY